MHNDAQHLSPLPQRPNVPNVPAHIPALRDCFGRAARRLSKAALPQPGRTPCRPARPARLLVDHREAWSTL